ncbi:unnamed protein product [Ilex paraguariensis]|uniref:Uncharacterized protein n=1 Tax=Ilex paraguariensis TaxID=185542 RepID=A0ABC8T3K2_9AQUA
MTNKLSSMDDEVKAAMKTDVDKAVENFKKSSEFFELGMNYWDAGFENFHQQAITFYPGIYFFIIQFDPFVSASTSTALPAASFATPLLFFLLRRVKAIMIKRIPRQKMARIRFIRDCSILFFF